MPLVISASAADGVGATAAAVRCFWTCLFFSGCAAGSDLITGIYALADKRLDACATTKPARQHMVRYRLA